MSEDSNVQYSEREALLYHSEGRPGKIEIIASKPMATQRDLALAYSPGVAVPVRAIAEDPALAYDYTAKGNLVAVISNGTAILGLGNLGALASKPAVIFPEGKEQVIFESAADLIFQTPRFYHSARKRLKEDLGGYCDYVEKHFGGEELPVDEIKGAIRKLKAEREGEIEVAGPGLAKTLTELGLIDEYRIYLHPVVLGQGTPYFAGPRPRLRLVSHDRIGADVIRLTYVPA